LGEIINRCISCAYGDISPGLGRSFKDTDRTLQAMEWVGIYWIVPSWYISEVNQQVLIFIFNKSGTISVQDLLVEKKNITPHQQTSMHNELFYFRKKYFSMYFYVLCNSIRSSMFEG